jgi:guanylate kinase
MNLEQQAAHYQPSEQGIETIRSTDIVFLVGISGAGKDTLQAKLLESGHYHRIVTHTTRSPRSNDGVMEQDGREYHFVSHEQMQELLVQQQLIEVNQYGKNFYGTSVSEFEEARKTGTIAISNIDVNGVASFRNIAKDTIHALFILPPDYATWRQRLSKRYHSDEAFQAVYTERRAAALDELEHALSVGYYHFIINDEIDRAVRVINEIAHREDEFNHHDREARESAQTLLNAIRNS